MSPHGLHPCPIGALAPGVVTARVLLAALIAANLIGVIAIIALAAQ